ncbi:hypothetical protein G7B40_036565 [Aetokthonos hydrillicola Thurmond2011]|jgi:hypothetical protein|uniref:Uncharacterized protein n=1 Tax=Aetokthonos hydrillicola Thurmond2011 TaxID=2712845 RepID=A0AAP5IF13_9CYAN|nr:hypothetical protein [Aetokthonos hydrillicola]MBO3457970.1 hypothetical protein [Aetokthonos hydrillicola CCALA 1050]MBW4587461.1 hypothetical protein [Aetokthonos hydrillicola CCALA 1050]MDR9900029.1 hypothetical protein [Aetokthonos hydrillicola Thurmond2011]
MKSTFILSTVATATTLAIASTIGFLINTPSGQAQQQMTRPTVATVKSMINGDISCYVDLRDPKGKYYQQVPARFEICGKEKTFLNKKVRLTYGKVRVIDCQSAEPCGKTRLETLITRMAIIR